MLIHFCSGSGRAEEGFLLGITPTTTSLKALIDLLQSMFFLCSGTIKIISSVHLTLKEACTFPHAQHHLFGLKVRESVGERLRRCSSAVAGQRFFGLSCLSCLV